MTFERRIISTFDFIQYLERKMSTTISLNPEIKINPLFFEIGFILLMLFSDLFAYNFVLSSKWNLNLEINNIK